MSKVTVSVRKQLRPISEEVKGYKLVAVYPNKAAWNQRKNQYVTSYHPKYIVEQQECASRPKLPDILKFANYLKEWYKFTEVEYE